MKIPRPPHYELEPWLSSPWFVTAVSLYVVGIFSSIVVRILSRDWKWVIFIGAILGLIQVFLFSIALIDGLFVLFQGKKTESLENKIDVSYRWAHSVIRAGCIVYFFCLAGISLYFRQSSEPWSTFFGHAGGSLLYVVSLGILSYLLMLLPRMGYSALSSLWRRPSSMAAIRPDFPSELTKKLPAADQSVYIVSATDLMDDHKVNIEIENH